MGNLEQWQIAEFSGIWRHFVDEIKRGTGLEDIDVTLIDLSVQDDSDGYSFDFEVHIKSFVSNFAGKIERAASGDDYNFLIGISDEYEPDVPIESIAAFILWDAGIQMDAKTGAISAYRAPRLRT